MRTGADILTELAVIRGQRGEAKAFEIPVKLWQTRLQAYAVGLVGETEAANDAMLEVWMAVSRGIRRVDDPARFRSWVYRIVRNKRADLIRSEQARRRLTQKLFDDEAESSSDERGDDSRVDKPRTVIRTLPEE